MPHKMEQSVEIKYLIILSFVADLSLGLTVSGLTHIGLGPAPVVQVKNGELTWLTEISFSWPQRLVLLAVAIAMVRLLHSYVILNTRRDLSTILLAEGSRFHQAINVMMKFILILGTGYFMYVIWNPEGGSWILSQFLRISLTKDQIDSYFNTPAVDKVTISSFVIFVVLLILSLLIYLPLFIGELAAYIYIRASQARAKRHRREWNLLLKTFRNWLVIDAAGFVIFILAISFILVHFNGEFKGLMGVSDPTQIGKVLGKSVSGLFDRLELSEWGLFALTLTLTGIDYRVNLNFYSSRIVEKTPIPEKTSAAVAAPAMRPTSDELLS
jgi:hypothetical protein